MSRSYSAFSAKCTSRGFAGIRVINFSSKEDLLPASMKNGSQNLLAKTWVRS